MSGRHPTRPSPELELTAGDAHLVPASPVRVPASVSWIWRPTGALCGRLARGPTSHADERRGLRYAGYATLGVILIVALLTVIPGGPLGNPDTGKIIGDSPFMDSIVVITALHPSIGLVGVPFGP